MASATFSISSATGCLAVTMGRTPPEAVKAPRRWPASEGIHVVDAPEPRRERRA